MGRFDGVLLTVDFDRTLTAPDSTIPERNLMAIREFMAEGGYFTVNTGRSTNTFRNYIDVIPTNAPLLLYNGSADYENGKLVRTCPIDLDVWETMKIVSEELPDMNLEIQGVKTHYLVTCREESYGYYKALDWLFEPAVYGMDVGPFLKFSLFGRVRENSVGSMFSGTPEELARFDYAEKFLNERFAGKVTVFRAAPRIIDVHTVGVSKLNAARLLQKKLGCKLLVCVGDAENDITMLDGADYAYCPCDGVVADRYENVCCCAEGAVADVIYKKIPEILQLQP